MTHQKCPSKGTDSRKLSKCSASVSVMAIVMASVVSNAYSQDQDDVAVRDALESAAALLQQGQAPEALNSLSAIDAIEPDNPWLWYYRGQATRLAGNLYQSLEAFDRALDELSRLGDPDPALADRLRRERRGVSQRLFKASFQMGLAYDSNVTFRGADTSSATISGRGDGKFATRLQIDHVPYINEREALTLGVTLSHAWHYSIEEFNYQEYAVRARYTRRLSDDWTFDFQYDYDFIMLGNDSFLSNHTLSTKFTYQWPGETGRVQPVETQFDYRIEARDFLIPTSAKFDRDGYANSIGLAQRYRVKPLSKRDWWWDVFAGYRLESVATEGSEFDRINHNFYLSAQFLLTSPWMPDKDLSCRLLASWEMARYRNNSLIDRQRRHRQDLITTLGIMLSQTLVKDPKRGDLILHAILNWTDSDSNVIASRRSEPFTYDKIVAGFQLEWRF